MNFLDFKNSSALLSKEQMKNVKGGQLDYPKYECDAYYSDGRERRSFQSSNEELLVAWCRAWVAAGYSVSCNRLYYA